MATIAAPLRTLERMALPSLSSAFFTTASEAFFSSIFSSGSSMMRKAAKAANRFWYSATPSAKYLAFSLPTQIRSIFCITASSSPAQRFKVERIFLFSGKRHACGRSVSLFSQEGTFRKGSVEFPEQIPAKWGPGAQHWGGTGDSELICEGKVPAVCQSKQAHLLALVLGADQRTGGGQAAHAVAVGVGQL